MKTFVLGMESPESTGGAFRQTESVAVHETVNIEAPVENLDVRLREGAIEAGGKKHHEGSGRNEHYSKKGGKGGGENKGKGKKGGKAEDAWNDLDAVEAALGEWRSEVIDLDLKISEQQEKETGDNPSVEMEKLLKRKEVLEKRVEKGNAKIEIDAQKQEIDRLKLEESKIRKKLKNTKGDAVKEVERELEACILDKEIAMSKFSEMTQALMYDFKDVKFTDNPQDRDPSEPLHLNLDEDVKTSSKILGAVKGATIVGGATVGSMFEMAGGFLKDLYKSWSAHVKRPGALFGGQSWKDFFWRDEKKKK